jgi:hypothetical protein
MISIHFHYPGFHVKRWFMHIGSSYAKIFKYELRDGRNVFLKRDQQHPEVQANRRTVFVYFTFNYVLDNPFQVQQESAKPHPRSQECRLLTFLYHKYIETQRHPILNPKKRSTSPPVMSASVTDSLDSFSMGFVLNSFLNHN